jgi:3-carboxy-cis,cis-muconate cycloisomerase
MAGRLVNALGSSALAAEAFSDLATLRHMLRFEAALAQSAADAGLIPKKFAPIIVKACDPALYDPATITEAERSTATLTVQLVKHLKNKVDKRDADAAGLRALGRHQPGRDRPRWCCSWAKRCRRS